MAEEVAVVDAAVAAPEARVGEGGEEGGGGEGWVVVVVLVVGLLLVGEVSDFGEVGWARGALFLLVSLKRK